MINALSEPQEIKDPIDFSEILRNLWDLVYVENDENPQSSLVIEIREDLGEFLKTVD